MKWKVNINWLGGLFISLLPSHALCIVMLSFFFSRVCMRHSLVANRYQLALLIVLPIWFPITDCMCRLRVMHASPECYKFNAAFGMHFFIHDERFVGALQNDNKWFETIIHDGHLKFEDDFASREEIVLAKSTKHVSTGKESRGRANEREQ